MTQDERERRAREIAALGWEGAAELPIRELDLVAFGYTYGGYDLDIEDIHVWDRSNWETAAAEVKAEPQRWVPYLDRPLDVEYRDGKLQLMDGHHRLYTAKRLGRPTMPAWVQVKDNPIRRIMAWVEDPSRFELNPEYRRIKRRLMR